ncbi:hypothetical protein A0H81_13161 [Grifola frondosa]|uniref:Uncharacterized protein n=1 Tax=Grifola frondosa TaxID=5627 RepID=A0A1C7LQI3_GRIFR|nr:hypothetical protein A0H81_13161 [Grifola frondosa]
MKGMPAFRYNMRLLSGEAKARTERLEADGALVFLVGGVVARDYGQRGCDHGGVWWRDLGSGVENDWVMAEELAEYEECKDVAEAALWGPRWKTERKEAANVVGLEVEERRGRRGEEGSC